MSKGKSFDYFNALSCPPFKACNEMLFIPGCVGSSGNCIRAGVKTKTAMNDNDFVSVLDNADH